MHWLKIGRGLFEEFARWFRGCAEQALHFPAQFIVARAEHAQVGGTVTSEPLQGAVKDLTNLRPSLRRQGNLR